MKNLKRALSFALASVMLVGMMVVGASAADFGDVDKIVNTEAVQTMVALGVIKGKDTGNFDPEGIVTRAEMAKIICVMLNGGKDVTGVTKATPTYTDIKGHWAEGYIEYCSALGIIAGRGDGTFQPDGTVTGTEAAKMLLVALGYDSDVFAFTGANWGINVNSKANEIDLYDGIEHITVDAGLTRDNTAQMAYNTLEAKMMERTYDKVQSNGEISYNYRLGETTFLNEKFDAKIFIGTFDGNTDTLGLSNDGYIQVSGRLDTDAEYVTSDGKSVKNVRVASFPCDLDIANIGEEVKVIFKDGKSGTDNRPDKNDTIYGVFNTGKTEVYNVTKADIQEGKKTADGKIKFGGAEYELAADSTNKFVINYNYGVSSKEYAAKADAAAFIENNSTGLRIQSGDTIKFVANEDGKIYAAYVVEYKLAKVTSATSTRVTLSGVGSIDVADNDVAENLAVDDIVVYTRFYDGSDKDEAYFTVAKAETVEGEITGYTGTEKVVIDGTTYKIVGKTLPSSLTDDSMSSLSGEIDTNVIAYMVAGMVGAIDRNDEEASSYALVIGSNNANTSDSSMSEGKIKLLLADGTKTTYVVDEDSTIQASDKTVEVGKIVKYSITSDGTLKVKSVVSDSFSSSKGTTLVWDESTKLVGDAGVAASNAVIYVNVAAKDAEANYKVYNIRDLDDIDPAAAATVYFVKNSAGRVTTVAVDLNYTPAGASSDTVYGMVVASNGVVKIDDEEYKQFTVWTGENVTINVDPDWAAMKDLATGKYISFNKTSDDLYTANSGDMKFVIGTDGAVKEYSTSDATLSYYTATKKVDKVFEGVGLKTAAMDDDAVIIYVNRDGKKAGDEIGVGAFDTSTGYANVKIVFDENNKAIVALFVETSGECDVNGNKTALAEVTAALDEKIETATASVLETIKAADGITVTEGDKAVTISGTAEALQKGVLDGKSTGLFEALRGVEKFEKATFKVNGTAVKGELLPTKDATTETGLWTNLQAANAEALKGEATQIAYDLTVTADGVSTSYSITLKIVTE